MIECLVRVVWESDANGKSLSFHIAVRLRICHIGAVEVEAECVESVCGKVFERVAWGKLFSWRLDEGEFPLKSSLGQPKYVGELFFCKRCFG